MDFFQIGTKETKGGIIEVYPDFTVGRSKDLMVRGRSFYAIWDEERGLWSTDEYDVQRLVDEELSEFAQKLKDQGHMVTVKYLRSFGSNSWTQFQSYVNNLSDNSHQLDMELTFQNTEVSKNDYVSKRLPYSLEEGDHSAWDELVSTLYSGDEKAKIEWAIGAVVSGDSKTIQKFMVFYGPAGTGKSTILNVVQRLFQGYTTTFEAKALGNRNAAFATEVFKDNPLVAIQHDGDLSRIDDNTKLNSIVSHEEMTMNEKYKPSYTARVNSFLFMGTNQPVKISDAKSGIIRRLIDVHPTGVRIPINHYHTLISRIDFELGAIAHHCLRVYRQMGKNYYNGYRPTEMMLQTDVFFNFVEAHYDIFKKQDGVSLKHAYELYKKFCEETGIERTMPQYKVREELRNYFEEFKDRAEVLGETIRSYYSGFNALPFKRMVETNGKSFSLVIDDSESLFDHEYVDCPAQYAKENGTPKTYWADVDTTLGDLDTTQLHYVQVPDEHIVIDFDLKDDSGEKSLELNLEAASNWPPTYAELSQSGNGVHLHYIYDGDTEKLDPYFSEGIEVKVYHGGSSLRRKLTKCNNIPVATINSGLPLKEKKVEDHGSMMTSEKGLRELIKRNLRKEIHPGTKPSVDFIKKILDDAYKSGLEYDVTDMRSTILAFANNSTNQSMTALKTVQQMKFQSEEPEIEGSSSDDDRIVFFDVEVYPNLFVVCWKYRGDTDVVRMINPEPQEIEQLLKLNLVGFNNRRYDNHILYARFMGYDLNQLFILSSKIVDNNRDVMFRTAYGLSYTDIYDFSAKKQGLKKFMIELGMDAIEMDIPWDEPVPEERIDDVVEYCVNDVIGTEATFEDRYQDFVARKILSDLSGLSVNDTTQRHTARIIFGNEKNPQRSFVYTDLSKEFPGYEFDLGTSTYREETPGEGGYVHAEPGIYSDVVLLDVASMHPTTIIRLNLFGEYTKRFEDLVNARLMIKRGEFDKAREVFDGALAPYLEDTEEAEALSYALKIVINIVYGLTSARFNNPFKDTRNIDNIVAKRGALFMIDLKHYVREQGFTVAHIKTDSIKIPGASEDLIQHVMQFGEEYGYDFEHEATYDKFCLVNDAVYIARAGDKWTAVGAQFQHPYVYKTLFTGEEVTFDDLCETKNVTKGNMYLRFPDNIDRHVGRTGRFIPVLEEGGAELLRINEDKEYAVTGTKGYFWIEASIYDENIHTIDMSYFENLKDKAVETIEEFGDFEELVNG